MSIAHRPRIGPATTIDPRLAIDPPMTIDPATASDLPTPIDPVTAIYQIPQSDVHSGTHWNVILKEPKRLKDL
jgi:hypothetical protein